MATPAIALEYFVATCRSASSQIARKTRSLSQLNWVRLLWRDVAGSQIGRLVEESLRARAGMTLRVPVDRLGFPAEAGLCLGSGRFPGGR